MTTKELDNGSISWAELANLTHATQVARFNWCSCEEGEESPFYDCPKTALNGEIVTRNDEGRYIDQAGRFGYSAHFTGAYICYTCGALCDCGEDTE